MGTLQRWSSRQAAPKVNKAMKSQILTDGGSGKSRVGGAPKRQAIGSLQVGEFESADALYLPGSETETEDEDMCMVSNDAGLAPGPFNRISTNDRDEEQHPTLSMCAASLKRMSLGPDHGAPACVNAKNVKKEPTAKRNVKCRKRTSRDRGPIKTYKWVLPWFDVDKVPKLRSGYKKD